MALAHRPAAQVGSSVCISMRLCTKPSWWRVDGLPGALVLLVHAATAQVTLPCILQSMLALLAQTTCGWCQHWWRQELTPHSPALWTAAHP